MLKRLRTAGLIPALVITLVLAVSFIVPASANRFNTAVGDCGYPNSAAGPPTVTGISPSTGTWQGGTSVTITGTDFCEVTNVNFDNNTGATFTRTSRTSITVITPAGTPGQVVDVTVTAAKGTSATSAADKFTFSFLPSPANPNACSRLQYNLTGNNGSTWVTIDAARLSIGVTPSVDSYWIVTGNADLWTSSLGYNQDLGITVYGGTTPTYPTVAGQPQAWKESGGTGGTFSPNAAAVQTVISLKAGQSYGATLQWKANQPDPGTIWAAAGPVAGQFSETCIISRLVPVSSAAVVTRAITTQKSLTGNGGVTWQDMDTANLSLTIGSPGDGVILFSGNSDLWTDTAGINQDIAITVGSTVNAWKESGGAASTFSPNAAFVQTVITAGFDSSYTAKLQWKAQQPTSGTIYAGAGPVPGGSTKYSETRLTALFLPTAQKAIDKVSTSQYSYPNSNGVLWTAIDSSKFALSFTPTVDCTVLLSANVDLWTTAPGVNQDIGITVSGTLFPTAAGQPEGWKESGGGPGIFSPNAAYLLIPVSLKAATAYTVDLVWKANQPTTGAIFAGAGPIGGAFSPTRLTLQPIGC